jgi:peptidoglycan/LPS O-acetylase OafA/YrhL
MKQDMPFLNTLRWVSAALVAYGHIFLLVYPSFTVHESLIGAALVAAAKLRYLAVTVFFVVSGYLIGGSFLDNPDRFSWRTYFIHRFARIYAPLVPAILLTVFLDHLALNMDANAFIYTNVWPTHVIGNSAPIHNYQLIDIFSGIFSLESFAGNPIGSNAPLWSLGLEWGFYFIFPAIFLAFGLRKFVWQLTGTVLGAVMLWLIIGDLSFNWLIWCSGALARRWLGDKGISMPTAIIAVSIALLSVGASFVAGKVLAPMLFVSFGAGLAIFLQNHAVMRCNLGPRMDKWLADMSYSLYITHVPVAVFCVFLATRYAGMQTEGYPLLNGLPLFLGIVLITFSTAWLFSVAFERRTPQLRRFLRSKVQAVIVSP